MASQTPAELGMYIDLKHNAQFSSTTIHGSIIHYNGNSQTGVTRFDWQADDITPYDLSELVISAHGYTDMPWHYDNCPHMEWNRPQYDQPYSVNLERAEKMVRTLKRIQSQAEKDTARDGAPSSIGQRFLRTARALGVTSFTFEWSDDGKHSLNDGAERINRMVWTFEHPPKEVIAS